MQNLFVIKISGNIIDEKARLHLFLTQLAALPGNKILVHGGGRIATQIGDKMGIESKYIDGRRITDAETIDVVTMVYAGLLNKQIVAFLQAKACNALGLSGVDANILPAIKRPVNEVDYGFVGDILSHEINTTFLKTLLEAGSTLVMAPITHDKKGQLLNTNADTIAQEIAKAMSAYFNTTLIYLFEKSGVLLDINNENSAIALLKRADYLKLKTPDRTNGKAVIFEGMIPKLDNAFAAITAGVTNVIIGKAEDLTELIKGNKGTTITHA